MVTAQVASVGESFNSIIQDRDVVSLSSLAVIGALGGTLGTQVAEFIIPRLNLSQNTTMGRFASGAVKVVVGGLIAFLGLQVGGAIGAYAGVAGIVIASLGGADWVSIATNQLNMSQSQAMRGRTRQPRGSRSTGGSSSRSSATVSQRSSSRDGILEATT